MRELDSVAGQPGEAPVPIEIQRDQEDAIVMRWSDGEVIRQTAAQLRRACPCATCREKKRGEAGATEVAPKVMSLPILSKAEARPLRVESMQPVGSYAYQISFSDGHSSGIYPFALLRQVPDSDASEGMD